MNQFTQTHPLLNLNHKLFFNLGLGRPLALSVGSIGSTVGSGAFSCGEKRRGCSFGVKLKWRCGGLTGQTEDLPYCPDAGESKALFCPLVAYGWITPLPPEFLLELLNWMNWKNCLKQTETWQNTNVATSHRPHSVVVADTTLTPKSSS